MAEGENPGDPGFINPGDLVDSQLNLIHLPEVVVPLSISGEVTEGYISRVSLPQGRLNPTIAVALINPKIGTIVTVDTGARSRIPTTQRFGHHDRTPTIGEPHALPTS